MMRILSVCTGNICRSPTAEGIFRHLQPDWHIDSCGIADYHIGESPDSRAIAMAEEYGVDLSPLRARQISLSDFYEFDLILGMDKGHVRHLQSMRPSDATAEVALHMAQTSEHTEVPDPYYGGMQDFRHAYELSLAGVQAWIRFCHASG